MPKGVKGFQKGHKKIPGSGMKKGQVKKPLSKERIIESFQFHGPAALAVLLKIAKKGKTETARVMAAKEILDRGYGKIENKPAQPPVMPMMFKMYLGGEALPLGYKPPPQLSETTGEGETVGGTAGGDAEVLEGEFSTVDSDEPLTGTNGGPKKCRLLPIN